MVRWLLRLYPASFRHAHGRELEALIARERRDVRTPRRILTFWLRIVLDACVSAAAAHRDILVQDLRDARRACRRSPGFAATVLVLVALGIGATTAAFSLADVVLLRPLPFPDADRLVKVWERRQGFPQMELSPANYRDWKAMATSFETFSAYRGFSATLIRAGSPSRIDGTVVAADLLQTLGVQPRLGRGFTDADDREGAPATVLLSHGLWEREFGASPSIVGTTIRLDDEIHTVVGVMPRDFHFPRRSTQLWVPMRLAAAELVDRNDNYLDVVARVRRGVSLEQARSEMALLAERLKQAYPAENAHTDANVTSLRDELSQQARLMLLALAGAAACVLLLACSNLANLLVARAIGRRREMALRLAIGAGRERLARQVLTETLLLTGLGGLLGVALAAGALPALARLVPSALPIADIPTIDLRVLGFAVLATAVTGLSVSLVPLLWHARDRVGEGLREGARAIGAGSERTRGALVVTQLVASVVLLVMCGLLLRALWTIRAVDPGFTTSGVLTARTSLPMPKYEITESRTPFYARVLSEVRALPGVVNAAYISFLPLGDMRGGIFPVGIGAAVEDRREQNVAFLRYATPGYFEAMNIPLHGGRDLADTDTAGTLPVVVVSRSFARQFFDGQEPLGRAFHFAGQERTIVGVVGDVKVRGLMRVSEPQVYVPYRQAADTAFVWYAPKDLVVRTSGEPMSLVTPLRAIVRAADPDVPVSDVRTLVDVVDGDTAPRVTQLRVLVAFAALAMLLGGIGIHGLLAFTVSARATEIGVRLAIGAHRVDIVSMIARRAFTLAAIGIAIGLTLAYVAGRAMQSLLAGVAPSDGLTALAAMALVLVMTVIGSLVSAVRAASVDPASVLRSA